MIVFETLLVMLLVAVLLRALARKLGVPYPVLLALAGALSVFVPMQVEFHLDPALVLALFVAPVLLDAGYDASPRDLRRYWRPITSLALIAVGLTTAAVAVVVHGMVPGIPWAAASAIGAIVAPPDAVAVTTVLRDMKLPHRIGVILEGEALLNDAATLLIYRLALAAVLAGGSIGAEVIAPAFLLSSAASIVAGPAIAWVWMKLTRWIDDAPSAIIVQFVGAFGIWVLAERVGLSPVLVVVGFAMTVARTLPKRVPARLRMPSYAVWETAVVVLNVVAFLLIGFELKPVLAAAAPGDFARWAAIGAAVLATVIVVRLTWTLAASTLRWQRSHDDSNERFDGLRPSWRTGLIIGWAGTRGIVTVATALALPQDFPERGLLLFVAFAVTLGTLLIQGLTLKPLILALGVRDDEPIDREVREARIAMATAALESLGDERGAGADFLREEFEAERRDASDADDGEARPTPALAAIKERTLAARRDRLLALRSDGTIGDDAFHRLEEELDYAELAIATRTPD